MIERINMHNEPKRILQVVTYMGRGGIETMLMNYYRHINRSKIQFDFLVHRDFSGDFDEEIKALGGHIYHVPPMNPLKPSYWKALRQFFLAHPYHTVHCHLNFKSGIVLAMAKKSGIPIRIAHAHTSSMSAGIDRIARKLMKLFIPYTATDRLACSNTAGTAIFGSSPFSLIANAIETERFCYSDAVRNQVRANLHLDASLTIMHIGRFSEEKNHTFLLDAFAELLKLEPSAKLLLVGDGELREEIENKANNLLPTGSVHFLGTRTDVAELLQAADVFLFPSHFEGLPVTMIEAQAAGLPCIKSDAVTDECVVTDLVTSLPITDPTVWAKEALRLRSTPRKDQSEAIRKSGYDIETAAQKLEHFYLHGEPL